jgi:EAL domain-containing protein (putative c-di-GMP-specific phosphodiesterase class I)
MSIAVHSAPETAVVTDAAELDAILRDEAIVSLYQPIVNLSSGETIGFEALSRGPAGSRLEFPDRLFAAARRVGRLAELDWACRAAAFRGALEHGLRPPMLLFVNVEPEAAFAPPAPALEPLIDKALEKLRIVAEFTERGLTDRPTEVLAAARSWRGAGMAIALDDITADSEPLSMLPFVHPDIIKLDLSLIQDPGDATVGATLITINAWAEHSGTLTVAEGIETEEHLARARSLGADFGQGWMYGRPEPLDDVDLSVASGAILSAPRSTPRAHPPTPFDFVSQLREPRIATKLELLALSRQLELHASSMGEVGVVIATLQNAEHFSPRTRAVYRELAPQLVIGSGLQSSPEPGVLGATIEPGDPLQQEWNVVTVSPYFCGAMVAKDLGDTGPDLERRFLYCISHDPAIVAEAALPLIKLIAPLAP